MTPLYCKSPVGNGIKKPEYATSKDGMTKDVSLKSPMQSTDTGPNLSKKFKYPNVSQSVPDAGKGQYE